MEWAQNGSLAHVLKLVKNRQRPSFWTPTGIGIIISGIVLGMRYVHSRGFIHQDLKPSNILLNDKGQVLIGDFGIGRDEYVDVTPTGGGTVAYAAPEMFQEDVEWTQTVDVYSFGLILYEILVGSPVFPEDDAPNDIIRKKRATILPTIGSTVLPSMRDLIQACWQSDSANRPSFDDILNLFEAIEFEIVADAHRETVADYVKGVTDWELDHPLVPLIVNSGSASAGPKGGTRGLEHRI
jgi:serine/threonine protein kinase